MYKGLRPLYIALRRSAQAFYIFCEAPYGYFSKKIYEYARYFLCRGQNDMFALQMVVVRSEKVKPNV